MPQYKPIDSANIDSTPPMLFDNGNTLQDGLVDPYLFDPTTLVDTEYGVPGIKELGRYDKGLRPGYDQDTWRGDSQWGITQLGIAALKFGPSVLAKTGESAALAGGLIAEGVRALGEDEFSWGDVFDNDVAKLFRHAEETLDAAVPIHASKKYTEGNLAKQLFTTSFWSQDAADGFEFLASALIPGSQFAKIGSVSKALLQGGSKYSLAAKMGKIAEGSKKFIGQEGVDNLTGLTLGSMYATTTESMVEGVGVFNSVMEKGGTEEKASEAAYNTFMINMAALSVPNFLQQKWALGRFSGKELVGLASTKGLTKESFKPAYTKAFAKGLASEGLWEENIQLATEEFETNMALGTHKEGESIAETMFAGLQGFASAIPDIITHPLPFGLNTDFSYPAGSTQDKQGKAIALGGIIGGPFAIKGERAQKRAEKRKFEELVRKGHAARQFIELAEQQFVDDVATIYTEFGENEDGSINYLNEEGNLVVDENKLRDFLRNGTNQHILQEEALHALSKNDMVHYEAVRQKALALLGYKIAAVATRENLSEEDIEYLINSRLESIDSLAAEEKAKEGGASPTGLSTESANQLEIQKALNENKATLRDNIKMYRDTLDEYTEIEDFEDERDSQRFNNRIVKAAFYAKTLNKSLNKLLQVESQKEYTDPADLEKRDKSMAVINDMIQANNKVLSDLKKNRATYKKEYIEDIQPYKALEAKKRELEKKNFEKSTPETLAEIDLLEYQMREYENIEGVEDVKFKSEDLASALPAQVATPGLAPGQTPSEVNPEIPLKQQDKLAVGNTAMKGAKINTNENMPVAEAAKAVTQLEDIAAGGGVMLESIDKKIKDIEQSLTNSNPLTDKLIDLLNKLLETGFLSETEWGLIEEHVGPRDEVEQDPDDYSYKLYVENQKVNELANRLRDIKKKLAENSKEKSFSRTQYILQFANKELRGVIQAFKRGTVELASGEVEIDETFEDVPGNIKNLLNQVRVMLSRFKLRTDLEDTQEVKDFIKQLELYEKILDKLYILLQEKAVKRDQLQKSFIASKSAAYKAIIEKALKPIVGENVVKQIIDKADQTEFPFIYMEAAVYKLTSKFTPEQKKEYKANIKALKNAKIQELASLAGLSITDAAIVNYKFNPYAQRLVEIVGNIIRNVEGTRDSKAFEEFKSHVDFFFFKSSLEATKYEGIKKVEEVRNALENFTALHNMISEIHQAEVGLTSRFKLDSHVEMQIAAANAGDKTPTLQQNYVIRKLLTAIATPFKNTSSDSIFRNVFFLQGFIGTGKTVIGVKEIYKALNKVLNIAEDKIVVTGHSNTTSANLNNTLKGKDEAVDINKIASGEISLEGKKILIIDEGAAIPNEVLHNIAKHANKYRVKILLVGDLTQNKLSAAPWALTDLYINSIDTLSVIYRTSVPAVSNASLAFKGQQNTVTEVSLTSNRKTAEEVHNNNTNLLGAMKATKEEIVKVLSKPSTAKRVLIVTNDSEVAKYRGLVDPGVKVVNFIAVQGTEFDEAYVILEENLNHPVLGNPLNQAQYNSGMYTSIGRASKFSMFYAPKVQSTNTFSNELESSNKELLDDFKKIGEAHRTSLEISKEALGITSKVQNPTPTGTTTEGETAPVAPVEDNKDETADDIDEEVQEDEAIGEPTEDSDIQEDMPVEETPPSEEEPTPSSNEVILHRLEFPSNTFLRTGIGSANNDNIDTSEVYIVKDANTGDLVVVAKDKNLDRVYVLAVLGTEEIQETPELQPFIKEAPTMSLGAYNSGSPLGKTKLGKPIKAHTQKLVIHTGGKLESFNPLNDILKFFNTFFKRARGNKDLSPVLKIYNTDGTINWNAIKDIAEVKIFTHKEVRELPKNSFKPAAGQPMLVFKGIHWSTSKGESKVRQPLMIPLKAKKYSEGMNIPYMKKWLQTINTTYNAFSKLEEYLSSRFPESVWQLNGVRTVNGKPVPGKFNQLIMDYAKAFYKVEDGKIIRNNISSKEFFNKELGEELSPEVLGELDTHLDTIVRNTYGTTKTRVVKKLSEISDTESYQAFRKKDRETLKKGEKLDPDTFVYVTYLDSDDNIAYKMQETLAINKGPAQKAMNAIASANKGLGAATEAEHYVTRKKFFRAKNLLGSITFGKNQYGHLRKLWRVGAPGTRSIMSIIEGIGAAVDAGVWDPIPWIQEDGRHLNIRVATGRDGVLKFFDSGTPQALINVVEHVADHVRDYGLTYLGKHFNTVEDALEWVEITKAEYDRVMSSGVRESMSMQDMREMSEAKNLNLPLFKRIVPTETVDSETRLGANSIDNLGSDLSSEENRNKLSSMLDSNFTGVTPTSVTIELPKVAGSTTRSAAPSVVPPVTVPPPAAPEQTVPTPPVEEATEFDIEEIINEEFGIKTIFGQVINLPHSLKLSNKLLSYLSIILKGSTLNGKSFIDVLNKGTIGDFIPIAKAIVNDTNSTYLSMLLKELDKDSVEYKIVLNEIKKQILSLKNTQKQQEHGKKLAESQGREVTKNFKDREKEVLNQLNTLTEILIEEAKKQNIKEKVEESTSISEDIPQVYKDFFKFLEVEDLDFLIAFLEDEGIDPNDLNAVQLYLDSLTLTEYDTTEEPQELEEDLSNADISPTELPLPEPTEEVKEAQSSTIDDAIEEALEDVEEEELDEVVEEAENIEAEGEIETEVEEPVIDPISDNAYTEFVNNGNVSDRIIGSIAKKIKEGKPLSPREQAILANKTAQIEEALNRLREIEKGDTAPKEEKTTEEKKEVIKKAVLNDFKKNGLALVENVKSKLQNLINKIKKFFILGLIVASAGSGLFFTSPTVNYITSNLHKFTSMQKQYLVEGAKDKGVQINEVQLEPTESVLLLAEHLVGIKEKGDQSNKRTYGSRNLGFTDESFEKAMKKSGFQKGFPWCNLFIKTLFSARANMEAREAINQLFNPSTITTFFKIKKTKNPYFQVVDKKDLKVGSIVYYGNRRTWKGHVVLVTKINKDGSFETIEGNVGDKGEREGYKVGKRTRTFNKEGMKFLGVINPNYDMLVNPAFSFIQEFELMFANNTYVLSPLTGKTTVSSRKNNIKNNTSLGNDRVSPNEFKCKE